MSTPVQLGCDSRVHLAHLYSQLTTGGTRTVAETFCGLSNETTHAPITIPGREVSCSVCQKRAA